MKENNEPVIQTSKINNLNHINWDDYFATFAIMTSLRSKDPDRQVGAVIVSKDNRILSTGYNGGRLKDKPKISKSVKKPYNTRDF